jgi:hypothetical protein
LIFFKKTTLKYGQIFFFFGGTGVWTQGFTLTKQAHSTTWVTPSVHFVLDIGFLKLFAWADLEPWPSWPPPPM